MKSELEMAADSINILNSRISAMITCKFVRTLDKYRELMMMVAFTKVK